MFIRSFPLLILLLCIVYAGTPGKRESIVTRAYADFVDEELDEDDDDDVDADSSTNDRCTAAAKHLESTAYEMRKLYIPAIENPSTGNTITGNPGCMVTQAGWWTYEFCFGDYIRQFHSEGGVVHDEHFIGLHGRALDKSSAAHEYLNYRDGSNKIATRIKSAGLAKGLQKDGAQYSFRCEDHSTSTLLTNKANGAVVFNQYDSGSVCGTSADKKRRSATVLYICDSSPVQPDPSKRVPIFFDIVETEPCTYQIFVRGDNMCSMMNMQVPPQVSGTTPKVPAQKKRSEATQGSTASSSRRTRPAKTVSGKAEATKESIESHESMVKPIISDERHDEFEPAPVATVAAKDRDIGDGNVGSEADGSSEASTSTKNNVGFEFYAKGLDDPLFFADSFIMAI